MTTSQTVAAPAGSMRLIHAAMLTGVLLFALVVHFKLRPTMATSNARSTLEKV